MLLLLTLVLSVFAHWPYPDVEDKFRQSGLALLGSPDALDPTFSWVLSPFNNQFTPTFQLNFPHKPLATDNTKEGLIYTVTVSHLAEVLPTTGSFTLVPGSYVSFQEAVWYADTVQRFYDEESMGEVIKLTFLPFDPSNTSAPMHGLSYTLRLYPDSDDDLVDIGIQVDDYPFVNPKSHLAVFFKITASKGDEGTRTVPMSIDYEAMTFEVNPTVGFVSGACPTKRSLQRSQTQVNARGQTVILDNNHEAIRASRKFVNKLNKATRTTERNIMPANPDYSSAQLWIEGGYVAAVLGVVPEDINNGAETDCVTLGFYSTIALRSFRPAAVA